MPSDGASVRCCRAVLPLFFCRCGGVALAKVINSHNLPIENIFFGLRFRLHITGLSVSSFGLQLFRTNVRVYNTVFCNLADIGMIVGNGWKYWSVDLVTFPATGFWKVNLTAIIQSLSFGWSERPLPFAFRSSALTHIARQN
jgi:hypothetical protein